jgi:uncharacterized protein (DUF885 family)
MRQRLLASTLAIALAAGCATPGPRAPSGPPEPTTPSGRLLRQAMDAVWERALADSLYLRLKHGLPIAKLPDLSYERAAADVAFARSVLERLSQVRREELDREEELSLDILAWDLAMAVEGHEFFWLGFPVTPYSSPLPMVHRAFTEHPFRRPADAERYLSLLDQYPRLIDQLMAHLRRQMEMGIVLPRSEIALVIPMVNAWSRPPAESLFRVAPERLTALPPAAAAAFEERVARAIEEQVNRSLVSLAWFLSSHYETLAPEAVGLWQYPDGDRYYRYLVRLHTSLDLTPEQVHETGLKEVERIGKLMARQQRQLGWGGPRSEFHRGLAEHPRFHAKSPEEVGQRLMAYVRRIEPRLAELFRLTPKAPYRVARLDPNLESAMTYGYYQPPSAARREGIYYFNGSQLDRRSLAWAQSLIYHELVPGHHFQIALQYENSALHPLRRENLPGAFVEGWAEYASDLGFELGLYDDPYDRYGRYAAEMFLALRLVVDTGMNHRRWPREQAVELMRRESLESEVQIATETLRYAVDMPGQALAYKLGALKIRELRRRAEEELGPAFDVREFHRAVLGSGAMPLAILEQHLERFIAEARQTAR